MDLVECMALTFPAIFLVVDPIGAVPVFVALTGGQPDRERRGTARRATLVTAAVLLTFAVAGGLVFRAFGISLTAFKLMGGLLLVRAAFQMMEPASSPDPAEASPRHDVAVMPLAIPLLAGPGAIATVMVLMVRYPAPICAVAVVLSVLVTSALTWLLLRGAQSVQAWLSPSLAVVVARISGLLVGTLGTELIVAGVKQVMERV